MRHMISTKRGAAPARIAAVSVAAALIGSTLPAASSSAASLGNSEFSAYPCHGFAGFEATNPASDVERDVFTWGVYKRTRVGNGRHDIDWKMNPHKQDSWITYLNALSWTGSLAIKSSRGKMAERDPQAILGALAITQNWVKKNPYPWKTGPGAGNATHSRVGFMLCLREGLQIAGHSVPTWLDTSLAQHATWLRRYPWTTADHNIRTEQNLAVFGVGCVLRREGDMTYAVNQLARTVGRVIDAQGVNNEQAMNYAHWNYELWGRVDQSLTACGVQNPAQRLISRRRQALLEFLAYGTRPNGALFGLGDTPHAITPAVTQKGASPELTWIGTDGAAGHAPKDRVKIYDAGYIFGRSSWAKPSHASAYSLRFGPVRTGHGHSDHTSITWDVGRRPILVDAGTGFYNGDAWRKYYMGPAAHNQLVVAGMTNGSTTTLVGKSITSNADFYRFSDTPYGKTSRTRSVIVLSNPDVVLVADNAKSSAPTTFTQLWHLPYDVTPRVKGTTATASKNGVTTTVMQVPAVGVKGPALGLVKGRTKGSIQGWQWTDQASRRAAPVLTSTQKGRTAAMVTAIAAGPGAATITASTKRTTATYTIRVGRKSAVVTLDAKGTFTRTK